ncbi:hypothetical protein ACFL2D_02330 [Patescibacteria group bacterium]
MGRRTMLAGVLVAALVLGIAIGELRDKSSKRDPAEEMVPVELIVFHNLPRLEAEDAKVVVHQLHKRHIYSMPLEVEGMCQPGTCRLDAALFPGSSVIVEVVGQNQKAEIHAVTNHGKTVFGGKFWLDDDGRFAYPAAGFFYKAADSEL